VAAPDKFQDGGVITCFMGIAIIAWKLLDNYKTFISDGWGICGVPGAVAGIMICDYWIIRKRWLLVNDLYLRAERTNIPADLTGRPWARCFSGRPWRW
jgi:cytosine/uracil/thiamine/allantoin permease